jgi:hypothetical protein
MIAQDARWAADVMMSAQNVPIIEGCLPLVVGHHVARIAYEGAEAIRSGKPIFGVPELAVLLDDQFAAITAIFRHVSKWLDNTSTNYESIVREIEDILERHGRTFPESTNLGLYRYRDSVVGATIPMAYRLGIDIEDGGRVSGEELREISEEWGRTLAVLGVAALDTSDYVPTFDFTQLGSVGLVDLSASEYLEGRFEKDFSVGLKLLLLAIEGDLNTSRLLLPHMAYGYEMSVFRMREVSLYHALTSLAKISSRFSNLDTAGIEGLRSLLGDAPAERLRSQSGGLKVRDRCVHYPILNPTITPDFSLPMYGLVEAVFPEYTWDQFYGEVIAVTNRVAEHLATWTPSDD